MVHYDPRRVASFYDEHGHREGLRPPGAAERASWRIHSRVLREMIRPGDRVLEIGAGLGQVTQELARLGARVVATDIASRQLERHQRNLVAAGLDDSVERRLLLDLTDLARLPAGEFDAVVCYRGPLGYALEQAEPGVRAMVSRLRRGRASPAQRLLLPRMPDTMSSGTMLIPPTLRSGLPDRTPPAVIVRVALGSRRTCRLARASGGPLFLLDAGGPLEVGGRRRGLA
jgi:SAM-dependent methyltransferase